MSAVNSFLILSLICLCLYLIGFINFLTNYEENGCRMTYMYGYPEYVKINLPEDAKYSKYGLYAYSEGRITERTRAMRFDGIPVIFVPGNGGSYKQVRSLASVSLKKAYNSKSKFHFDYFSVGFNEELSGLFGGVLEQQTEYLNHSIYAVLKLYKKQLHKPKSVIIVGHSMGGIITQGVLTNPEDSQKIDMIITLASPHARPVVSFDYLTTAYYNKVYNYFQNHRQATLKTDIYINAVNTPNSVSRNNNLFNMLNNKTDLSSKLMITIGGGQRDILVPSGLTYSEYSNIHALTTSIPGVWVSTDHQCIVWCLQLNLVLNRLLFAIVDPKTLQISTDFEHKLTVASSYLQQDSRRKNTKQIALQNDADWIELSERQFSLKFETGINKTRYQMIRLFDNQLYQMATIESINFEDEDWLYGCNANSFHRDSRICLDGYSLNQFIRPLPSARNSRYVAYLDLHKIKEKNPMWTHVIVRLCPTHDFVQLNVDIFNRDSRAITTYAPRLAGFSKTIIIQETAPLAVHYDVIILGLDSLYQGLLLEVTPVSCSTKNHHSVATSYVPWSPGHSAVHYFTESRTKPMSLRLHQSRPAQSNTTRGPRIRLVLDQNCKYIISVRSSIFDSLGQLARHFSFNILPYMAAILILTLRQQILDLKINKQCCNLLSALTNGAKPYYIVTFANLASKFLNNDSNPPMLLPLALYATAWSLIYIAGAGVYVAVVLGGQTAHLFLLKIFPVSWSYWLLSGFEKLPVAMGVLLISIASATTGGLALFGGALFYFVLISKMYENLLEDIMFKSISFILKNFFKISKKDKNLTEESVANNEDAINENELSNSAIQTVKEESQTVELKQKNSIDQDKEVIFKNEDGSANPEQEASNKENENINTENTENVYLESKINENTIRIFGKKETDTELDGLSCINFHLTVFLVWVLVSAFCITPLLTWAHNFRFTTILSPDPSYVPALILCICGAVLWQMNAPRVALQFSTEIGYALYGIALGILIFPAQYIYLSTYSLCLALILVTLLQAFSKEETIETDSDEQEYVEYVDDEIVLEESIENDVEYEPSVCDTDNGSSSDLETESFIKIRNIKGKLQQD